MRDEFRVRVHVSGDAHGVLTQLKPLEDQSKAAPDSPDTIAISHEHENVFLYAGSQTAADRAVAAAQAALTSAGAQGQVFLQRWHPVEERWENADAPLPASEDDLRTEQERLRDAEREESASTGWNHWQVRIVVARFSESRDLAKRLREDGLPVMRRFRYVIVGAPSEADAAELQERLRAQAPQGAQLVVEANSGAVHSRLPFNFAAFFGGLGQ